MIRKKNQLVSKIKDRDKVLLIISKILTEIVKTVNVKYERLNVADEVIEIDEGFESKQAGTELSIRITRV